MAQFFDTKEIFLKANKLYENAQLFVAFMEQKELFPYSIKLQKLKQSDIQKGYQTILKEIESLKKLKLEILYQECHFKTIGSQTLPMAIIFQNQEQFLKFIDKQDEFFEFVKNYEKIIKKYEVLQNTLLNKPKIIVQNQNNWDKLLKVCDFFLQNPRPNIYTRELAIEGVDTKFIENNKAILDILLSNILPPEAFDSFVTSLGNYGFEKKYALKYPLPLVRFRILDDGLKIANLSDITLNIQEFMELNFACENVFIVENQITTLSFPKLKNSIVIFGSGYAVGMLKDVAWLQEKKLYYWGDIDKDGFAILSQARSYFQNLQSIFMDEEVIELFKEYAVADEKNINIIRELNNLTLKEMQIYLKLQNNFYKINFRLEQERIPFDYIQMRCNPNFSTLQ